MPKKTKDTKTIKLSIYFWTNIKEKGIEMPKKTCWDSGFVHSVSNNRHSIRSGISKDFITIEELPKAIKDVLRRCGVTVVSGKKDKEYIEALKKIKEAELIS